MNEENNFKTITEALGYLNRGGHYFNERNMLSDETIIAVANDIYACKLKGLN